MVDVMAPKRGETVSDSACGTGGFLLAAQIPFDRLPSPAILRSRI
jgi:type I restriction-modification system DNA methylase subunit